MKTTRVHILLGLVLCLSGPAFSGTVVLELFTSQGCSSCPPADALLARLSKESDVLALSFHVDYWDYLGWKDPYAHPDHAQRQRRYAQKLGDGVYTPQLIVHGQQSLVGSRESEVRRAIAAVPKKEPQVALRIFDLSWGEDGVAFRYSLEGDPGGYVVHSALVAGGRQNTVPAGENRGRRLSHANVVLAFQTTAASHEGSSRLTLDAGKDKGQFQLVVYVQNQGTLAIEDAVRVLPSGP